MDTATEIVAPRPKIGRPPGYPKTGGRKKGVQNKKTVITREAIAKLADPVRFLCDLAAGKRFLAASGDDPKTRTWLFPTAEQRLSAATALARKIVPDAKVVEIQGGLAGNQLIINLVSFSKHDHGQHP